ncbi:MAG: type II methionyl aminopeptidase [Candidatus Bathyarchaeota archaeon]|nr:type II methionyl aminopeptidase [Candidatus Bathyarchaeota archaeon]
MKKYKRAGRIASEVRKGVRTLVKPGTPIIDICEKVEKSIIRKGGQLAFPCNVCVNEVAAHYSSPPQDKRTIPNDAIVKIDIGVHVDGYIADTATTVNLKPEYDGMVFAIEKTLEQVIKAIQPNVQTRWLGETAKKTIEQYGFKPIWNLTGHQMKRYALHAGKSIPSVPRFAMSRLKAGEVFAVEPFLTLSAGSGEVRGLTEAYILRYHRSKSPRHPKARELLDVIEKAYRYLPFSRRWLKGVLPPQELDQAFKDLLSNKSVSAYPVLVEKNKQAVAQAEHTLIVTETGCVVTTS